jgi:hypothetical protein
MPPSARLRQVASPIVMAVLRIHDILGGGGEIENVQLLCKAGFFKIITVHLLINPFTGHFFLYDDIFTLPSVNLIFLQFFGVKHSFNTLKNWPNFFFSTFYGIDMEMEPEP